MVQHDKSTGDLNEAIGNIEKICGQYMASVSKALTMTELSPAKKHGILNEIKEHEQMIISICQGVKLNIQ